MPRTLDASPAQIVRQLLIDLDIGSEPEFTATLYTGEDWPAFYGAEPPVPDNLLLVNDTTGELDGRTFDGEIQEHFGFQILIRSIKHSVGWFKAFNLRATLAESVQYRDVRVGDESYLVHAISGIGQVLVLGKHGPSKRSLFTVNALLSVRQR